MPPRAEHWVGIVELPGRERQNLGQRSNCMVARTECVWEGCCRIQLGFVLRQRCIIPVVWLSRALVSGCSYSNALICPGWASIPSEQGKCYQPGCPHEISSICGYMQGRISQSKFLFWDHGIWIALCGPWCSQHLLVVCLKFQFGPALGSDKRGRAWCCTKGGCLTWNFEQSLVAGGHALSLS